MVEYGPIQLVALAFPDIDRLRGDLLEEASKLSQKGLIRVIGAQAVLKDENGEIAAVSITDLPEKERVKLGAAVGALIGLGAAGELGELAGAEAGAEAVAENEFGLDQTQIEDK